MASQAADLAEVAQTNVTLVWLCVRVASHVLLKTDIAGEVFLANLTLEWLDTYIVNTLKLVKGKLKAVKSIAVKL